MNLDIGAKRPINGDQVFVVGQCVPSYSEPPFVLLYDTAKRHRAKRNIRMITPVSIVDALGQNAFTEIQYPGWGRVWIRSTRVRHVRPMSAVELENSSASFGSVVLFTHDRDPEDQHAGFMLFGMEASQVAPMLLKEPTHSASHP